MHQQLCARYKSQTLPTITVFRHRKMLHTLIAMGGAAPYPGNCDLKFLQETRRYYNCFFFLKIKQKATLRLTPSCLHGGGSLPKNPSKLSSTKAVMRPSPGAFWPSGMWGRGSHAHQAALHSLWREGQESILQLSDVQLSHPLHVTKLNKHHLQLNFFFFFKVKQPP